MWIERQHLNNKIDISWEFLEFQMNTKCIIGAWDFYSILGSIYFFILFIPIYFICIIWIELIWKCKVCREKCIRDDSNEIWAISKKKKMRIIFQEIDCHKKSKFICLSKRFHTLLFHFQRKESNWTWFEYNAINDHVVNDYYLVRWKIRRYLIESKKIQSIKTGWIRRQLMQWERYAIEHAINKNRTQQWMLQCMHTLNSIFHFN